MIENKQCSKCRALKHRSQFWAAADKKSGLKSQCKECASRKENTVSKARRKVLARSRLDKNRKIVLSYLGGGCVDCGEKDIRCLHFDHLRDKKMEVAKLMNGFAAEKLIEEIKKCEVRCSNCHMKKTSDERSWWKSNAKQILEWQGECF